MPISKRKKNGKSNVEEAGHVKAARARREGLHRVRIPGMLIVVDFLFGQNVYFMCSLPPPPPPLPMPMPNYIKLYRYCTRMCSGPCLWVSSR